MRYRKGILILALAVFLLSIAGAWAIDTNDTVIDTVDEPAIELSNDDIIAADENEGTLKVNEQTFRDLNNTINGNSDRDIYLDNDYKYSEEDSAFKEGIIIDRDLNVYGNGHTINGSNQARIFKINNGTVVFHNITFTNGNTNDDGGAINGECTAIDCTFTNNTAKDDGGAMNYGYAINCTFTNNTAENWGGAMYDSSAINCTFTGNTAGYDGGAMEGGSAINCTFTDNTAKWNSGAMDGGSAINCTFTNNTAEHDGGAMDGGSAINCTFTNNTAKDGSGGAMIYGSAINCTFTGNTAEDWGGAMFNSYYLACIGQEGDYYDCDSLVLYFEASDFNSTYKSNKMFQIILTGEQCGRIDFINVDVVIYNDGVGEVMRYSCLSGDSLIFDLAAGNYTANLIITYPNLDPKPTNITLTINKATPKIEVTANESTYPNDVIVNVKTDVGGEYMVTVGDKTQMVTLEANVAQDITFTGLAANETGHTVNVTNMDIENCTKVVNDTAKAILHKATPKIEVTINESTYPGDVVVYVKVDVNGTYMVKVGDEIQNVTLEANVTNNITFHGLAANEDGFIVNVTNNDIENCTKVVNDTAKAVVHKATPKIEVTVNETTYPGDVVVNIKSDVNGTYIIKIGDKTQNITLESNVTQNITFTGLAANETGYIVNVTHDSENYTGFNDTAILKIKKATPAIAAAGITATYNINRDLVITLTDSKGKPLAGERITVSLNGAKTYTTDKNGQIKVTTKGLKPKTYTAAITYSGNENHTDATSNAKVTVKKAKPKITAKKKTYKSKNKKKKFTITLKDNKGKAIKNAKVRLIVKKITTKKAKKKTKTTKKKKKNIVKTNKKGKATFKVNRNKKGKYQAIIKYKGNKYYTPITKKVKITIK